MIEAIPLNSECIVLIITKVEDPEELDTRFSKFAPSIHDAIDEDTLENLEELPPSQGRSLSEEIAELFHKIESAKAGTPIAQTSKDNTAKSREESTAGPVCRMFSFHGLQPLTRLAGIIGREPLGDNRLYKSENGCYVLVLELGDQTPASFSRICNIVSEYGDSMNQFSGNKAYFEEHFSPVIQKNALANLAELTR